MKTLRFIAWLTLDAFLLSGCQHVAPATPPAPVIVSVATNAVQKRISLSLPMPHVEASIVQTNVVICLTNPVTHIERCFTNPTPLLPRTNFTLSWLETNFTAGHSWMSNRIVYSTNGVNGPWNLLLFVAVTNTNMNVTMPINFTLHSVFYRIGTLAP